jgi:flagellar assembly factor FliW
MFIQSTRFGQIEIREDTVIVFPDGLIGLGGTRYALVARDDKAVFYWLHSIDDPSLALPVTVPWPFFADYDVKLSDEDAATLKLESPDQAEIFCVVRATDQLGDFTINLRGPIVINGERRLGRQVINEVGGHGVREPLFSRVPLSEVRPATPAAPVAATGV